MNPPSPEENQFQFLVRAIREAPNVDACLSAYRTTYWIFCGSETEAQRACRRVALEALLPRMRALLPNNDRVTRAQKWASWLEWLPDMLSGEDKDLDPQLIELRDRIAARVGYLSLGLTPWND